MTETDQGVSFKQLPPFALNTDLAQTTMLNSSIEDVATKNASHLNLLQEPEGNI